jgi:hypothetical protein
MFFYLARSFTVYSGIFFALALPWLRVATHAAPAGYPTNAADQWLVPWILAWVAHALATNPLHLFDANINHPAPAQLAGIEHFVSTQLVFAPVFWLSGNAILATNVTTLLSYPLAALAMDRLLVHLGCSRMAATAAALLFALGPLRLPANFMVIKYLNLYLPLTALALTRLRDTPTSRRALALAGAVALALLSSYYLAVMVLLAGAIWGLFELCRRGEGRTRYLLLALAATGAALLLFVGVSLPYLTRPEATATGGGEPSQVAMFARAAKASATTSAMGRFPIALAALGVLGLGTSAPYTRRLAARGLVVTFLAHALMFGPAAPFHGHTVALPFAAIAASPARFFRGPNRFAVVLGFGTALLTAAALEVVRQWVGRRVALATALAVIGIVLITRGPLLLGSEIEEYEPQTHPIHDAVREAARREGDGALLELPSIPGYADRRRFPHGTQVEAMLGSTRHWQPLVTGCYGCYVPAHAPLLGVILAGLPKSGALDELVDLTHLRWILLRPESDWRAANVASQRTAYLALAGVRPVVERDGWTLLRVDRTARHPDWFPAVVAGARPGSTLLGTRLAPLPEDAARAAVWPTRVPPVVLAGWPLALPLGVRNSGTATWPAAIPLNVPSIYTVGLRARWAASSEPEKTLQEQTIALRRDVEPGGVMWQDVLLATPSEPGSYELEIGARQDHGAEFITPPSVPLRLRLNLIATDRR